MTTTNRGRILVVDDDRDVLLSAQLILKKEFDQVHCLSNPSQIPARLEEEPPDLVLLDMNFTRGMTSGDEGLYWLRKIGEHGAGIQVVMSTAYGEIDLAVKAMREGAADFIEKPWVNEKLIATLKRCIRLSESHQRIERLEHTRQALNAELNRGFDALIGTSKAFNQVRELIDRVAATDANVLITGENGTGKELIAHAIHRASKRAEGPMISVDIGAVPATLFESEMFGHMRGSFTDAHENRPGKFELASGGTLFLDEIGNLELASQAKLLRALESRSVTRVGGKQPIPVDIRLLCATNVDSEALSRPEQFRPDLLYRINTVEIVIPPLRERTEDIPLLLDHYCDVFARKYGRTTPAIPAATLKKLQTYHWPGNVRELKHATERALIMSGDGPLAPENFLIGARPATVAPSVEAEELNLVNLEKQAIQKAISRYDGNLTRVARALGLGRTTLYRKMEKYGLADR